MQWYLSFFSFFVVYAAGQLFAIIKVISINALTMLEYYCLILLFYFLCYFTDKYAICSSYEYFISSDISSITVRLISETRLRMVQCPKDSRKCIRAVCVCVCVLLFG